MIEALTPIAILALAALLVVALVAVAGALERRAAARIARGDDARDLWPLLRSVRGGASTSSRAQLEIPSPRRCPTCGRSAPPF